MTKSADLPPPPDEYFLEIESHFATRRGTPFLFSAKDWSLIRGWKEEGIPLSIVIEAIDQCFDKRKESGRKTPISSLTYCRHAVRDIWSERRDLQVGADAAVPEASPELGIEALVADLRERASGIESEEVRRRVEAAAAAVDQLRERSVPSIEEALIEIEELLYADLPSLLPPEASRAIDEKLTRSLEGVEFRDEKTRIRTIDASRRRILRSEVGLPRLSLFR